MGMGQRTEREREETESVFTLFSLFRRKVGIHRWLHGQVGIMSPVHRWGSTILER